MKKNPVFICAISLTMSVLLLLTATLNIAAFENNYIQTVGKNNSILSRGIINKIEYSLKYGKSLENYYGIEDLFLQLEEICTYVDKAYIADKNGIKYSHDYKERVDISFEQAKDKIDLVFEKGSGEIWQDEKVENILMPIKDSGGRVIGCFGIAYNNEYLKAQIRTYNQRMIDSMVVVLVITISLFIVLFYVVKHEFNFKRLLYIVIPVVIFANVIFGIFSFSVYRMGYLELTKTTAQAFEKKIAGDIAYITQSGISLDEVVGTDEYLNDLIKESPQIDTIAIEKDTVEIAGDKIHIFPQEDGYSIIIKASQKYLNEKLKDVLIELVVAGITALMIAAEVVIFVISLFTAIRKIFGKKTIVTTAEQDVQPVGVVRGLNFFFSMFQYMPIAFIPIVMAHIYKPIFGLPYEIVMAIPVTMQILTSILSAWICGNIIEKKGWRPVALFGMAVMILGTAIAALAKEPIVFILAQIILGLGIGCSKTAFEIFTVTVASSDSLDEYTSGTNAGLIVGLSCSAAIGAVIANVFGFSGAFIIMAAFGIFVMAMTYLFGANVVIERSLEKKDKAEAEGKRGSLGRSYMAYIAFLILPYYFGSMFLDYFFPVFADARGMSTANIGHIFLAYGIITSYIGAGICPWLLKRFKTITLMTIFLGAFGLVIYLFAIKSTLALSIFVVFAIGIFDGIMPSLQSKYVYSLEVTKRIGIARVLGIEGAFSSAIRGVSPIVFGFVMMNGSGGLVITGIVMALCAAAFMTVNKLAKGVNESE